MPGSDPPNRPAPIAPPWHTATLIALIVTVAAIGTLLARRGIAVHAPGVPASRGVVYLQMTLVAWGLLVYVCRIGRRENALPTLLGQRWTTARRAAIDVGLAAAGWLLIKAIEFFWQRGFAASTSGAVSALLPQTSAEMLGWVVVSLSVGFSEEVVFRGYLQTQLMAFTGRPRLALLLQALLFGLAHGEQGAGAMVRIALYGLGFGVLARARRSLVPGIVLHVWTNLASGLVRF